MAPTSEEHPYRIHRSRQAGSSAKKEGKKENNKANSDKSNQNPKMPIQVPKEPENIAPLHLQNPQQLSLSGSEANAAVSPSSSSAGAPSTPRMRWAPELHEAFVEAVAKLGGTEKI